MMIFVALSTFAEYGDAPLRVLRESGMPYHVNTLGRRLVKEEIVELGHDSEGIIAGVEPYDADVLGRLPRLRCISRCGVGIDNIDLEIAKARGIKVLNTPDVIIQPVAELTVAMIFDLLRKLSFHTALVRSRIWKKEAGHSLGGKTVGILGLGRIGKRVAEIMRRLGNEVIGADLFPDREWADRMGVKIVPLERLLADSDILSIHLSSIKDRAFRLGAAEIGMMRHGVLVVNVSRGSHVDEDALFDALATGRLGGAALDVFPQEPYYGKLCDLDHVVLTPHVATLTEESRLEMEMEAAGNLVRFLKG